MSGSVSQNKFNVLALRSKKDKKWDEKKLENDNLRKIFERISFKNRDRFFSKFKNYPKRLKGCSDFLEFALRADKETGLEVLKLSYAEFCRIRHCPICQSRLSMKWVARFHEIVPILLKEHKNTQFLLLTLTVKNCDVKDLRKTIVDMNRGWDRLVKRKFFKDKILGFIKGIEVTKNSETKKAHPHFHVLLHVRNSYFNGRNFVTQKEWTDVWQDVLRINYVPVVDVRKIRESKKLSKKDNLVKGALEVVKYATKQSNIADDDDWFLEYCIQVDKLRFISTGGSLRKLFADIKTDNLLNIDEDNVTKEENLAPDSGERSCFFWDGKKNYIRNPKKDYIADLEKDEEE